MPVGFILDGASKNFISMDLFSILLIRKCHIKSTTNEVEWKTDKSSSRYKNNYPKEVDGTGDGGKVIMKCHVYYPRYAVDLKVYQTRAKCTLTAVRLRFLAC